MSVFAVLAAATPAEATIAFVQGLGTGGTGGTIGMSASVTTTGATTAGNSIFVFVATNNGADTISCSDPVNGVYTTDVNNGGLETAICSKHNALALPSGSSITVTVSPFPTNIRVSTAEFAGLNTTSGVDRTVVTNGIGTSPSVTLGAATSQGPELLIGVVNANTLGAAVTFTEGTNGTANNCTNTGTPTYGTLPSAQGQNAIFPIYCIVNATGTYRAAGSLSTSQNWTVAMATYRMAPEATVTVISPSAGTVTYGTAQTFTATVTASAVAVTGGTVTFTDTTTSTTLASGVALNGSGQAAVTVTLATGAHTIQAVYNPDIPHLASSSTTSVTVTKASPTISTTASAGVALGGSVTDTATIAGGVTPTGTVTFRLYGPNDATCTGATVFTDTKPVSGNGTYASASFTPTAPGAYRWIASYSGDANHNAVSGNCNDANESVTIAKLNQTILFPAIPAHAFGDPPFGISATASSTLTVTFSSVTPSVCTVSVATVTIIAAGTCTIAADQAGNGNYNAAPQVQQTAGVTKNNQTITFPAIPNHNFGDAPFGISATSSASLTVTFSSTTPSICSVAATTVTLVAAGTCTVAADQAGNANYNAAPQVTRSFSVLAANSFTGPTATGTGNATVSFSGGGAGCSFAPTGTGSAQSSYFIPLTGHAKSPPAGSSGGIAFPHGLLDFVLVGCTPGSVVTFTVTYPAALPAGTQYWKYGPTASQPAAHWYVLPATFTGSTAVFSITDGGAGDDDLAANGTIVDQGGPGVPPAGSGPIQTPTLSEWALFLLASLMLVFGWRTSRRVPPRP